MEVHVAHDDGNDPRMIGHYRVFGQNRGSVARPEQLTLDTSVAIDIERFYFGLTEHHRDDLRRLLSAFSTDFGLRGCKKMYGFANLEVLWNRTGPPNTQRARQLSWAVWNVLGWEADRVEREFSNRHPPVNRDKHWPAMAPPVDLATHWHPLQYLMGIYAPLLYIYHLERSKDTWRQKGPAHALDVMRSWMRDDLGSVGAYEYSLAIDVFLGGDEARGAARKLLKLGHRGGPDEVADRLWHAAWDIFFTRWTDGGLMMRHTGGIHPRIACVTGDKDPWNIRLRRQSKLTVGAPNSSGDDMNVLSLLVYEGSSLNPKLNADTVNSVFRVRDEEFEVNQMHSRLNRNPDDVFSQGLIALRELESKVGLERSTVEAYLSRDDHRES